MQEEIEITKGVSHGLTVLHLSHWNEAECLVDVVVAQGGLEDQSRVCIQYAPVFTLITPCPVADTKYIT